VLKKRAYILFAFLFISVITIMTAICIVISKNSVKVTPVYRLLAYENNVALYKNDELITIYDEIVLNSLTKYDQESFKKGIIVSEINKIDEIIEDYE